ncbi:MAG: helix-turn-helix domain-containing protein [Parvibaculales bacterium]
MKKFKIFCMKKRAGLLRLENPDPEAVRQFACMYLVVANISIVHRMPINAIMDTRRGRKRVSEARQLSQYLCHISFRQSFSDIGKSFKRDRTSVSHACQRIENLRDVGNYDLATDCLEWGVVSLARSLSMVQEEDL